MHACSFFTPRTTHVLCNVKIILPTRRLKFLKKKFHKHQIIIHVENKSIETIDYKNNGYQKTMHIEIINTETIDTEIIDIKTIDAKKQQIPK